MKIVWKDYPFCSDACVGSVTVGKLLWRRDDSNVWIEAKRFLSGSVDKICFPGNKEGAVKAKEWVESKVSASQKDVVSKSN